MMTKILLICSGRLIPLVIVACFLTMQLPRVSTPHDSHSTVPQISWSTFTSALSNTHRIIGAPPSLLGAAPHSGAGAEAPYRLSSLPLHSFAGVGQAISAPFVRLESSGALMWPVANATCTAWGHHVPRHHRPRRGRVTGEKASFGSPWLSYTQDVLKEMARLTDGRYNCRLDSRIELAQFN